MGTLCAPTAGIARDAFDCYLTTFIRLYPEDIDAPCSADVSCPAGQFCNFDDEEASYLTGACEPCDGCGAPDGCLFCGLSDAGAESCATTCTGTYTPPEGDGSIDCSGISPDLPCHAMLLIDEVRDAQSLRDIDPEIFCPCKLVRDAAPNWSPEVVGSCSGSGGGGR